MRYTAAAVTMAGVAAASWSPDAGSHGGEHGGWSGEHGPWGVAPASYASDSWDTEVVTATSFVCPEATQVTYSGYTWSVTEATTLVITAPVSSAPPAETPYSPVTTSEVESSAPPAETPYAPVTTSESTPAETYPAESTPVVSVPVESPVQSSPVAPVPVYPTNNGTTLAPVPAPSGTGSYTSATEGSPIPEQTGNSASTFSAGAAGILAVFGLVAAL